MIGSTVKTDPMNRQEGSKEKREREQIKEMKLVKTKAGKAKNK